MNRPLHTPRAKLVIAVAAVAVLSGCASVNLEQSLSSANAAASSFTDGQLTLARDQNERDALRQRASDLLAKPEAGKSTRGWPAWLRRLALPGNAASSSETPSAVTPAKRKPARARSKPARCSGTRRGTAGGR